MSKCTKPNCDCLERAEKANGGPLKDGYQCLYNTEAVNAAKEKTGPSPSLPETEQAIDPAEARRNIPYGMDEWCEAHQSYYKYECPECASLAAPDQPVPEEVSDELLDIILKGFNGLKLPTKLGIGYKGFKHGAIFMYKRDQAIIAALQSRISSTEAGGRVEEITQSIKINQIWQN